VKLSTLIDKFSVEPAQQADRPIIWMVTALCCIGIVSVFSSVSYFAEIKAGGDTSGFLSKHIFHTVASLTAMFIFSLIPYEKLQKPAMLSLLACMGLLVMTLMMGESAHGSTRWINILNITFQPSELARVALVVYLAALLASKQDYVHDFKNSFIPILVWLVPTVVLIGSQDFSTAALLFATVIVVCFVARVRVLHLAALGSLLVIGAIIIVMLFPAKGDRVWAYIGSNPFTGEQTEEVNSSQGEGYQARQAQIAIAAGWLTGVGPGKSVQRYFLPAAFNDFIFAIIAEEYGFVTAMIILGLFTLFLFRGLMRIARHAPNPFGYFLAVAVTSMVALYGFVNAGVACGLLPVTGLPLPFVSYGGSSLLANGVLVGILLNISRRQID